MSKAKDFKIQSPSIKLAVEGGAAVRLHPKVPPVIQHVEFPASTSNQRVFNFVPFYNKGFDEVVTNCQSTIERYLALAISSNQTEISIGTVAGYCNGGLNKFFAFCEIWLSAMGGGKLMLSDIDRNFIASFKKHLESKLAYGGQRTVYFRLKSVLMGIRQVDFKTILPGNPYPNIKQRTKSEKAYSKGERKRLVQALSTEIHRIKAEAGPLSASELAYCIFWISTCTGINTQPLLELRVDALQPHLFHPHKRLLVTYKRRGRNTHITTLRGSTDIESVFEMAPRVDAIFKIVESRNRTLRLNSLFPDSLFIFLQSTDMAAQPTRIASGQVIRAAKLLVRKYDLKGDDGTPLVLSVAKLRKTFVNRVFELSGYDPVVAAALAGHTIQVSDDHYLAPPPDAEQNHAFMGEIRNKELLSATVDRTSVASCKDNVRGHRAPKNGSVCVEVFGCFKCESFVVTGDDLYKIFSFYFYVISMRNEMGRKRWGQEYAYIIRVIDRDIATKFDKNVVDQAKSQAMSEPHPMWRSTKNNMMLLDVEEL
ncbi:hypothetical protein HBO38_35955 [Pseudomonas veronii]|uniref:Uncharacterized protein n=1 Tax=Pseudomonas veronii TaxID=76761 RepID=A0A7Y1FDF6_PSEVE|nr:hypothetical protein [Pseudomonas veronii]NMY13704.1 hypothetical protein [Pseudomonas veronii]